MNADDIIKALIHRRICDGLADIGSQLPTPGDYELTLIARCKSNPKAHIVETTEDNIGLAISAIKELMDQTDATYFRPQ